MNSLVKQSKIQATCNKVAGVVTGTSTMLTGMVTSYATNPFAAAETTIKNIFTNLQSTLTNVVVPIAGSAFIFCLIMMLASQNQKKVETYRSWAIAIFVCVIGVFAADFVIKLAVAIGKAF